MQEIKAVSLDSNHEAPSQHTHPQINFTRGHASWEKEKTGAKRNGLRVYLFVMFLNGCSILIAHNQ